MGAAYGGCVQSDSGNIFLTHAAVSHCTIVAGGNFFANGAGISAEFGNVTLIASRVDDNLAKGGAGGFGGGVYSYGTTIAAYSTITRNAADDGGSLGLGGAITTVGGALIIASTIDSNTAGIGGGVVSFDVASMFDSTISGNTARTVGGGLALEYLATSTIANSTVVLNHAGSTTSGGGIFFNGKDAASTLVLQSSIVAGNVADTASTPTDVYINYGVLSGADNLVADNLVTASNQSNPVVITISSDPKLGPLQNNGGPTRTHMLSPSSPAIGKGNMNLTPPVVTGDQRGAGYPRKTGPNDSVDLGAVQIDSIFFDGFNWAF
jgi:hypothetical protein